jgi:hypothetical protein
LTPPLATPFAARLGDSLASPGFAQMAGQAPLPSSPSVSSPRQLVRVSRRERLAGPLPPGPGDRAQTIAAGPTLAPATTRDIGAAAASPDAPLRIAVPSHGEGDAAPRYDPHPACAKHRVRHLPHYGRGHPLPVHTPEGRERGRPCRRRSPTSRSARHALGISPA